MKRLIRTFGNKIVGVSLSMVSEHIVSGAHGNCCQDQIDLIRNQLDEFSGNSKYCFENAKKVVANIQNKSNLVKFDINKIQI